MKMRAATTLLLGLVLFGCGLGVDNATRMERAAALIDGGDARAAAIELKNVLRADPTHLEARAMLGRVALQAGDPGTAVKELQRARDLGADPADWVLPMARALLDTNNIDPLLGLETANLQTAEQQADLLALQGHGHVRRQERSSARERYNEALARVADHPEALVGRANLDFNTGDKAAAEATVRNVIAQHPQVHTAHAVLARILLNRDEYAAAERSFLAALERAQAPIDRTHRFNYMAGHIDALLAQNKATEAQARAADLLELAPENPISLFQAARADFQAGKFADVIDKTQRVIAVAPDYQPARMLLGGAAMSQGKFALAELHLREVVNANPGHVQASKLLAQARLRLGSTQQALEVIEPLLRTSAADDPQLLSIAGSARLLTGNKASGLDLLERGAASGDPAVQLDSAASMLAAGEPQRALAILEAVAERSERRDILTIMALIESGEAGRARRRAEDVLAARPDDPASYRIMGGFLAAVEDIDGARRQFRAGLQLDPGNEPLLINLARLEIDAGDLDAARRHYRELMEAQPGSLPALVGLSQLAELAGNTDKAVEWMEQARAANPRSVRPALMLSRFYLRNGALDKALALAREAYSVEPDNPGVLAELGLAQLESGIYAEAQSNLEKAVQLGPANVEARFQLARAQLKQGISDVAVQTLRETLELAPEHLGARVALTRIEAVRGNYMQALGVAQTLREQYPDRAEPRVLEGDVHVMRGNLGDAIDDYDAAAQISPDTSITVKRYDARRRAGRSDSHIVLEEYLQDNPDNLVTRVALAQAYEADGFPAKAREQYERVLAVDGDNVVALNNLAWLLAATGDSGDLRRGIEVAQRAYELLPDNGAVMDTYAWLMLLQGDVGDATDLLRKALRNAPGNPDIQYHLAAALHEGGSSREARTVLDTLLDDNASFASREDARALREQIGD